VKEISQINYKYIQKDGATTILFLHGFIGSLKDWDDIGELLKEQYSLLMIDLPGHGKSPNAQNMEQAAECIITLLDSLNIEKLYIYGYSMGGRIALYLLLLHPNYFMGAILESASPGLKTEEERKMRRLSDDKLALRFEKESLENILAFWYSLPLFENLKNNKSFKDLFKRRLKNSGEKLSESLRTLGTGCQPSLWYKLRSNKIPISLLTGEDDLKFINIAKEMCDVNPKLDYKIIKSSGHTVYVENQDAVVDEIRLKFKTI
jgi:2-succinyl-6-hydroxy-2,4-cyclohexadiene-1-carboxylate synthase